MTASFRWATAIVVVAMLGLAAPATSIADDTREISGYVLTEGALEKYTRAAQQLAALPDACAQEDDDGSNSQTIDQMVAKLNAAPGAQAAIQSTGMTTREYVVFTFSIFQNGMAAWAVKQPGGKLPPGVSQANVDFVNKHEAELAALGKNDPCDEDSGEEETPEE